MSEDSDDLRFCETPVHSCSSQLDSLPSSPVSSPHRYQKPQNVFSSAPSSSSNASHVSTVSTATCPQPRQRGSDSEGRFPSSPSDICHSADLRRAALLRSVQMRTQPSSASLDLPFGSNQDPAPNIDPEERSCSYMKSLVDERDYWGIGSCVKSHCRVNGCPNVNFATLEDVNPASPMRNGRLC